MPVARLAAVPFMPHGQDEGGFSLVEVLIAACLLATVVASLPHLFVAAARANRDAGDVTWATVLAAQKLEDLRTEILPAPLSDQSVDYLDSAGRSLEDLGSREPAYTRRWWIEPLPSAPDSTIVITVTVSRYRRADEDTSGPAAQPREAARLVTLRTRLAS